MISTLDVFHLEISPVKELLENIDVMLTKQGVFHCEMSPLNLLPANSLLISVTFETFQHDHRLLIYHIY